MQSPLADDFYRAIYFLDQGQIQREMRFTEFEAFLDGYAGLSDLADTEVKAIYAVISRTLGPYALVFFRIYFDDEGRADSSWNIPLDELIAQGGSGPDLGEGPIRLVCRSRCPDPAFLDALWDPEMSPGHNDFLSVRRRVEANGLRFVARPVVADADIPVLTLSAAPDGSAEAEREQRVRLARLLRQQRLRIKTLEGAHLDATREIQREHRIGLQALRHQQHELEQQLERSRLANAQLKQKLAERNEQYLELQTQVSDAQASPMDEQSQAELVLLREQLERKNHEAELRSEQFAQMEQQIRTIKAAVPDENTLMQRLHGQSVFLVAYHPGVGHVTLPYGDIAQYFANPIGYAAGKCDLSQADYERWLAHYESPVCQGRKKTKPCGAPLLRISDPREFVAGSDDLCDEHRPASRGTAG